MVVVHIISLLLLRPFVCTACRMAAARAPTA
jgi:hypothetical protein